MSVVYIATNTRASGSRVSNLVQCKLLGLLRGHVAMSFHDVIDHSGGIWADILVQVWSVRVEDALLAELGARLQVNLLDLHHIAFTYSTLKPNRQL